MLTPALPEGSGYLNSQSLPPPVIYGKFFDHFGGSGTTAERPIHCLMKGTLRKLPLVDPVPGANGIPFPGGCLAAWKFPSGKGLTVQGPTRAKQQNWPQLTAKFRWYLRGDGLSSFYNRLKPQPRKISNSPSRCLFAAIPIDPLPKHNGFGCRDRSKPRADPLSNERKITKDKETARSGGGLCIWCHQGICPQRGGSFPLGFSPRKG